MLRTASVILTLSLFSFNSPEAIPMANALPANAISAASATGDLTFEQRQLAFSDHVQQVYQATELEEKGLAYPVFEKAYVGFLNLKQRELTSADKSILTIVDFTKSSNNKRLWVIDLAAKKVLFNTLVAHGRNTGNATANKFSNEPNSYMSSLGFYVTNNTYFGKHGLSLKLEGLDKGFNTNAMKRAIVVHGADYATADFIRQYGRLGRSLGCPALPTEVSKEVIEAIKDKTVLYVHSNDARYTSDYLNVAYAVENFTPAVNEATMAI